MKRVAIILIALFCLANILMLFSCKTKQIIQPTKEITNTIEKVVTKTERDTTFIVEADSSFYKAWIECVNNKPVLRNPTSQSGKTNLQAPKVNLDDKGQLAVECATENLELKARINELVTELNNTTSTVEYVPVEVEKELTFFQKLYISLGKIFGIILLGFVGYGAFKIVTKYYGRK
ncbi:hypothetical protein [Sphingobacterium cavernae]|uniref:hypothetical protein n=1 Tax=Sphingobacterium cavernae TaxID=2592657 RepID=UPI00123011E3|nr:hypothetical protein [Sphingobacterium cavernae]